MARQRDYKAEYNRRLLRAFAKGYSRSQARGHAKAGEAAIRTPSPKPKYDPRLETALREMRRTGKQGAAARAAGISAERFRKFLVAEDLAKRRGRTWTFDDRRLREMTAITREGVLTLQVVGFDTASLIGRHDAAVGKFLNTNNADFLKPFVGQTIRDASGRTYQLESRPNALHRLASSGNEIFEIIYQLNY